MKLNLVLKILFVLFVMILFNGTECIKENNPDDSCTKNRKVVHQTGELLVKGNTMWQMSVANLNGAIPDADKNCHTQLTLEFWFKKKELAKTNQKPPITITFFGGGGYFDPGSVATYITQKFSDSTNYWTAFCDQAAKNAQDNPTDFGIFVNWDPNQLLSLEDVGLSGIIDYKVYKKP